MDLKQRLRPGNFLRTGHRGARHLAPENTLMGFRVAAEVGVDIMELDVQLSADGEVVVIHDPTVDRTTNGSGPVATQTYAELAALDAGHEFTPPHDDGAKFPQRGRGAQIPLLRDVLAEFPEHMFTIELKPSPHADYIDKVATVVRAQAADRAILASFQHDLLERMRKLAPELTTSFSGSELRNFYLLATIGLAGLFFRSPATVLQTPCWSDHDNDRGLRLMTPRFLRAAHARGTPVQVWTINDPNEMRELIAFGVDGITTDRPDVLNQVLAE